MTIAVNLNRRAWKALGTPEVLARKAVTATLRVARIEPRTAAVSISFADDRTIAVLNGKWRAKRKPTNVLAFPASFSFPQLNGVKYLGDVVLAGGVVTREARAQGKPVKCHTAHLIVHGVLHLLGYGHADDGAAAEMERLEIGTLKTLGIPNPYRLER